VLQERTIPNSLALSAAFGSVCCGSLADTSDVFERLITLTGGCWLIADGLIKGSAWLAGLAKRPASINARHPLILALVGTGAALPKGITAFGGRLDTLTILLHQSGGTATCRYGASRQFKVSFFMQ
jgi:hypothetical protein